APSGRERRGVRLRRSWRRRAPPRRTSPCARAQCSRGRPRRTRRAGRRATTSGSQRRSPVGLPGSWRIPCATPPPNIGGGVAGWGSAVLGGRLLRDRRLVSSRIGDRRSDLLDSRGHTSVLRRRDLHLSLLLRLRCRLRASLNDVRVDVRMVDPLAHQAVPSSSGTIPPAAAVYVAK